jgi:O-methyltransferase
MIKKVKYLINSLFKKELILDYTMQGLSRERNFKIPLITNYIRISNFELVVSEIKEHKINGSIAEVGVFKGEFAKYMNKAFPEKKLYLFDTFEGFNEVDVAFEKTNNYSSGNQNFSNTSVDLVLSKMVNPQNCIIKKGYFPASLETLEDTFCFVSLDPDLYKPIYDGLEYFYPRLSKGGYIFIHDYNNSVYPGAKQAVRDYCLKNNVPFVPITDNFGTAVIAK